MPMPTPGIATHDTFQSHPDATYDAPFFYGSNHIMRAGRVVPAIRPQQWRNRRLIKPDRQDKYFFNDVHGRAKVQNLGEFRIA